MSEPTPLFTFTNVYIFLLWVTATASLLTNMHWHRTMSKEKCVEAQVEKMKTATIFGGIVSAVLLIIGALLGAYVV